MLGRLLPETLNLQMPECRLRLNFVLKKYPLAEALWYLQPAKSQKSFGGSGLCFGIIVAIHVFRQAEPPPAAWVVAFVAVIVPTDVFAVFQSVSSLCNRGTV